MKWKLVKIVGKTLANVDGTVLSLNPSSLHPPFGPYYFTSMPAGTTGQYEVCSVEGSMVVYNPTTYEAVVFGFIASVPNTAGLSAISVDEL